MIPGTNELVIDLLACAGGTSTGMRNAALTVDYAINHDPVAISVHKQNHPETQHIAQDVWKVSPHEISKGRPVGLLWISPDCTHHSKAKGGPPVRDKQRRELANVVVYKWVPQLLPRIIMLENVEEFQDWGPLDENSIPIKERKGEDFYNFVSLLELMGYVVDWRILAACDYGTPTIRKRLFLIARRDGQPIVWPEPTHGSNLLPYIPAKKIIDFSLPCPSIFSSSEEIKQRYGLNAKRPLSENTLRRIVHGTFKYVINNPEPCIVGTSEFDSDYSDKVAFLLTTTGYGDWNKGKGTPSHMSDINKPFETVVGGGSSKRAVTAVFLQHMQHASVPGGMPADEPFRTITAKPKGGGIALVSTHICKLRGTNVGHSNNEPLHTITSGGTHHALVKSFLINYYGESKSSDCHNPLNTVTSRDTFGLVTIKEAQYLIVDIGLRMLTPKELYLAQGFPKDYMFERYFDEATGKTVKLSKAKQVDMCGNAVCPPVAEALVRANVLNEVFAYNDRRSL